MSLLGLFKNHLKVSLCIECFLIGMITLRLEVAEYNSLKHLGIVSITACFVGHIGSTLNCKKIDPCYQNATNATCRNFKSDT